MVDCYTMHKTVTTVRISDISLMCLINIFVDEERELNNMYDDLQNYINNENINIVYCIVNPNSYNYAVY